jgi:hypothetical protein
MVEPSLQQKEPEAEKDLLEEVDFKKAKVTQMFTQNGTVLCAVVRMSSGNVICGG